MSPEIKILLIPPLSNYDDILYVNHGVELWNVLLLSLSMKKVFEQQIKIPYVRNKGDLPAYKEMIILSKYRLVTFKFFPIFFNISLMQLFLLFVYFLPQCYATQHTFKDFCMFYFRLSLDLYHFACYVPSPWNSTLQ